MRYVVCQIGRHKPRAYLVSPLMCQLLERNKRCDASEWTATFKGVPQGIRHCIDPDLWGVVADDDDDEFTTDLIDQIGLPRMIEGS